MHALIRKQGTYRPHVSSTWIFSSNKIWFFVFKSDPLLFNWNECSISILLGLLSCGVNLSWSHYIIMLYNNQAQHCN
jgi:hypothetical protein